MRNTFAGSVSRLEACIFGSCAVGELHGSVAADDGRGRDARDVGHLEGHLLHLRVRDRSRTRW